VTLSATRIEIGRPNPEEARAFMLRDRTWNAYGLGYLEGGAQEIELWAAITDGRIRSLLLRAGLVRLNAFFATGDPPGLLEIAGWVERLPPSGVFSATAAGLESLSRRFRVGTSYAMLRMKVRQEDLRPIQAVVTRRLVQADLPALQEMYGMWTDSQQLPGQLDRGVYFGAFERGRLVAVAGTHCITISSRIAAIGNVLTHAGFRNRGLGATTTTAVAQELFKMGCDEVVLNVRGNNHGARRVYERLGFTEHCGFIEGVFHTA
jgi:ribosomal protein S18 acetylase RimI-like enzyme